jgi:hypothetical protein
MTGSGSAILAVKIALCAKFQRFRKRNVMPGKSFRAIRHSPMRLNYVAKSISNLKL